jgi:hypothetical protein
VVIDMIGMVTAQAGTALSPEWDRGFDEAFAELVSSDPELVQAEFDALIGACWQEPPVPPSPPAPPASSAGRPGPPAPTPDPEPAAGRSREEGSGRAVDNQRSPP